MTERDAIARTPDRPATTDSLRQDLSALGIETGSTLLVHSSLSALGWVCGGAVAVIAALDEVLGPSGTLVMPTFTAGLSEPSLWRNPPVPPSWWPVIRETMPPFEPATTPTRAMGAIPECFRTQPGVLRSSHPQFSFAARGPRAQEILANAPLEDGLGDGSPLGRLYDLEASILLLGIGHQRNTSLHLAEIRAAQPDAPLQTNAAPILVDGVRRWFTFEELVFDDECFPDIGRDFSKSTGLVHGGAVGAGKAFMMPMASLVDFAVRWLSERTVT